MRPREIDYTSAHRQLSLFTQCSCCRKCKGFRPKIDGITDEVIQQKGLFYFNVEDLDEYDLFETCRVCQDSIKDHMECLAKKDHEEVNFFAQMTKDAAVVHKWLSENEERDKLSVFYQVYQMLMKSLTKCSMSHLPDFGVIPDTYSSVQICTNYCYQTGHSKEKTRNCIRLSGELLSVFNKWTIPTPKEFIKTLPNYDLAFYKVLYGKWMFCIDLPQKLKSLRQHEAPDMFGQRVLHAFLSHLLVKVPEDMEEELVEFAKSMLEFCEDCFQKGIKTRTPSGSDGQPIVFKKLHHRHDFTPTVPKSKRRSKEMPEVEPIKSKTLLQCIAKIVELERKMDVEDEDDKMAIDVSKSEAVKRELEAGVSEFRIVSCQSQPCQVKQEMAWLIQLKTLFCVQLPKMGNEYITRLIFDQNHRNLALIKNCKVIGGICFRPFPTQGFMEIVFLAVTGSDQIKGYGTILMNTLKDYAVKQGNFNLMTYADSFALGYFGKQGFSEKFDIPKKTYQGYIKDYEGATLMGCQLHPLVQYGEFYQYIKTVRDMHDALASFRSHRSDKHYSGIEHAFKKHHGKIMKLKHIPGLHHVIEKEPLERDDELDYRMRVILKKLKEHECAWPFLAPVDAHDVPEYYDFIKFPMDLQTMTERTKNKYYVHQRLFLADLYRMFNNCYRFNATDTEYYRCSYVLNELAFKLVSQQFPDADVLPHLPELRPQVPRY